ncbi:MAG TPA: thymidine phosphorylase [Deltaproteobacteria bacterium]|nr:thymidine phosphorylase [Deltaproteobacteria bacterium]
MHIDELLVGMRSGAEQSDERIAAFVAGVVDGSISRPQAAAWLAWAYSRGLTDAETVSLTRAMTDSGQILSWPGGSPLIDKHSTGGVGDKVSLVLAPLWAELGHRVPMVSGRGLGHTGGTLDKLEAIPGYRTDLEVSSLEVILADVGCFITGQTAQLAPADRVLYALRNETATVPSVPLIVGSILSKKLAAGVEALVLDVKAGSGAFMTSVPEARGLAEALVRVARGAGLACRALVTEMGRPLGRAVGNALEVSEAVAALQGQGPDDLRELVLALADDPRAAEVLSSGRAYVRFERMVEAQGGDPRSLSGGLLGSGAQIEVFGAPRGGIVGQVDALGIGRAAFLLGAGRRRAEQAIDPGVGVVLEVVPGDRVAPGEPLAQIHHRDGHGLDEARALLQRALQVVDGPVEAPVLVHTRIDG